MYSVLIWGAGEYAKYCLDNNYFINCHIKGFIDSYRTVDNLAGYPIYTPEQAKQLIAEVDYIIIFAHDACFEIFAQCLRLYFPFEKILLNLFVDEPFGNSSPDVITEIMPALRYSREYGKFKLIKTNERDPIDENIQIGKGDFSNLSYISDYFRYRSFEFMANQIIQEKVPGCLAELGVFKGEFAKFINAKFPNRVLYLFDTFEGFDSNEAEYEKVQGRVTDRFVNYFRSSTSVDFLLEELPYPAMCRIVKGLFPQSIPDEAKAEIFAFVSLDVDLEASTFAGLEFFYHRLSPGGCIFLHDYNSRDLSGVASAVASFERTILNGKRLHKIPLADRAGTLVILK